MILFGRNIIVAYNGEPTLRPFGVHREKIGPRGGFTAVGCWPLLMAVSGHMPNGQRWTRKRAEKHAAYEAAIELADECLGFEVLTRSGDPE